MLCLNAQFGGLLCDCFHDKKRLANKGLSPSRAVCCMLLEACVSQDFTVRNLESKLMDVWVGVGMCKWLETQQLGLCSAEISPSLSKILMCDIDGTTTSEAGPFKARHL